ncbi:MAG: hypothetical protein LQ352_000886 [Teloschistes flavicans]|nr:MAG: hypothetical protein LQ352_000886 [Teloschistes flavicans]
MATAIKRKADETATSTAKKPKANASITSFFKQPAAVESKPAGATDNKTSPLSSLTNPSPADPPIAAPKFDKGKWLEKLTEEQKELLTLEIETLHESWLAQLKDEILTKEFLELKRFLKKEKESGKTFYPPLEDVYSWSRHTPLPTVKAIILGQDPYHNVNQAHGLSFSVRPPTPAPPSLKNIYKALKNDYTSFKEPPNRGGLLTPWADRGVLCLNTCLTVRAHEPNSHAGKGWEKFTQKVIDTVVKVRTRGVVFLAWGKSAGERVKKVNRDRHCVLQSVHPSPYSADKGFFDCGHFKKTNAWLKDRYGEEGEINWDLNVNPVDAGV